MRRSLIILIILFTGFIQVQSATALNTVNEKETLEIIPYALNITVWEDQNIIFNNESVLINGNGNLTIINSRLNFSNFDRGLIIDNGSLKIIDSIIEFGGKCISGDTSGNLYLDNVTITQCSDDSIELEGGYNIVIKNSLFKDNGKHAMQFVGIESKIIMMDTTVMNSKKDGMNLENIEIDMINMNFTGNKDENLQIDDSKNIMIKNSLFQGAFGDNIKIRDSNNINIENVTSKDGSDDGIQITGSTNVVITDVDMLNNAENGFESDNTFGLKFSQIKSSNNGIHGFELIDMSDISINDADITKNDENGLFLLNTSNFVGENMHISLNKKGGIYAMNYSNAQIKNSEIYENRNFAINATTYLDENLDAKNNYFGTVIETEISKKVLGTVDFRPYLNKDGSVYSEPASTTSIEQSTTEERAPFIFIWFPILLIPIIKRKYI